MALVAIGLSAAEVARNWGAGAPARAQAAPFREAVLAPQRPLILDPLLAGADPASRDLSVLLDSALLRLDAKVTPVGDLATGWSVSGDGLTYRFQLAPGRRWSDGSPISAADVVATVALVQRSDFPDRTLVQTWGNVAVRAEGTTTVVLSLPAPRASLAVGVAGLPILPARVAGLPTAQLVATEHSPVPASGPMMVRSSNQHAVELIPNPYAAVRTHLAGMELRLEPDYMTLVRDLAGGQVDAALATNPAERAAVVGLKGIRMHDLVTLRFVDLLLNTRVAGLSDPVVRRALGEAVDRGELIRTALKGGGVAQAGAIPAGITWLGAGSTAVRPDAVGAARALDAAGYLPDLVTGIRARGAVQLAYTLAVPSVPPLPAVAEDLARQLGRVGVGVSVVSVAGDRLTAVLTGGTYQMAVADWDNGADPDVSAYWRSNATPPGGFNVSGLPADPFLDHALDSLASELDPELRAEAALTVNQRLAQAVPAVFLYAPTVTFAVSDAVRGVVVPRAGEPAARYSGIAAWVRAG